MWDAALKYFDEGHVPQMDTAGTIHRDNKGGSLDVPRREQTKRRTCKGKTKDEIKDAPKPVVPPAVEEPIW